jgi:hypothetical protein
MTFNKKEWIDFENKEFKEGRRVSTDGKVKTNYQQKLEENERSDFDDTE